MRLACHLRPCLVLWAMCLVGFLAGSSPGSLAVADEVHLRNGNVLEGRVSVLGDGSYRIYVEEGNAVTVPGRSVLKRVTREAPVDEFHRRFIKISVKDREALIELAAWGEDRGLRRTSLKAYRLILQIDPNHPSARDRLGYVSHRNRWVKRDELERLGLVRHRGVWMTPEDRDSARLEKAAAELDLLLEDVKSDNKILRQNAWMQLFKIRDRRLVPYLEKLLESEEEMDRVTAAQLLGNLPFDDGGKPLYEAVLRERRSETRHAMLALLRNFGNERVAEWTARDIRNWAGVDHQALRNLLFLASFCPHRAIVSELLRLLDKRAWESLADEQLGRYFDGRSRTSAEWREWWKQNKDEYTVSLNKNWIR